MSYYAVQILIDGTTWTVICSEEIAKNSRDEWLEWMANPARSEHEVLTVSGMSDGAVRSEKTVSVKMDNVKAIDVSAY